METTLGKAGLGKSWQAEFPEATPCVHCKGMARIGFVAHEGIGESDAPVYPRDKVQFLCDMHENDGGVGGDFWLHDCCAVAVYFCKKCLKVTALYNQA